MMHSVSNGIFVCGACCACCFFFSSRRRHTRCSRDWSSDVCSSDLNLGDRTSKNVHKNWRQLRSLSSVSPNSKTQMQTESHLPHVGGRGDLPRNYHINCAVGICEIDVVCCVKVFPFEFECLAFRDCKGLA